MSKEKKMIFVKLFIVVLLVSFCFSAVSGIVMFFIDMCRFGTPHKRFKTVSSIEKYNEKLEELEKNDSASEPVPEAEPSEPIKINL